MTKIQPLLTWRGAVCESDLPATARHVALTLSLYMSERGDSAYPGATRLSHDTGLSERSVRSQLALLVAHGWLVMVEQGGLKGEKRHANTYAARVPPTPLPLDPGTSFTREADSPVNVSASTPATDDTRPLNDVQPISSVELSKNSLSLSQRVNLALDDLAERDVKRGKPTEPRGYFVTCRKTRVRESKAELTDLAKQHPDWSPKALADSVALVDVMVEEAVTDVDCDECDNNRWIENRDGRMDPCPACRPIAGSQAS